ncbi:PAS domain-containing protein [Haloarchaeobius sp. DFWS5]|uniref:PAS domain-containing sensor histidine kinase n=1 Tax=Haloarchaeobius sp. DFWS5 TaxID=3446114 RepID=UPI003EBD851E
MTREEASERVVARSDAVRRVTDGVVALDSECRYTFVNERAVEILDKSRDDLIGECLWDVYPELVETPTYENVERALDEQEECTYEGYNPRNDQWFDVRLYPDEDGLSIYFEDITEKKSVEAELEQTNQVLEALVENTAEAIYVKDEDGSYQFMNESAAGFFGCEPDDLLGKDDEDLFDAESATEIGQIDERIVTQNTADRREVDRYIDGERHVFLDDKYPYRDEDGAVVGVMGISRDITERKQREQKLRSLTGEYEAVFENADDAIFLLDVDDTDDEYEFRFTRLNPFHEQSTGLTTEAVRGKTPREALGEETGAAVEQNYRRCAEQREPIVYEEELALPGGEIVWQTKLAPVIVDGQLTRIVGIARDITERVEREEELRRQNERLDEFTRLVSHDLRNPLNIAQAHTESLFESASAAEHERLESITEALDRMQVIVDDTLTLARQGKHVSEKRTVDVTSLADRCWRLVETHDARLTVVDEFTVDGDADRLGNVFENLFRNAVTHGGPAVTVRIGVVDEQGFYVEDDGPGVPPAERESVFEPGHSSTPGGSGFGLAIVRYIAQAHGWEVTCCAGSDGGTRFEFSGVEIRQ